jgi:hypothetical protein
LLFENTEDALFFYELFSRIYCLTFSSALVFLTGDKLDTDFYVTLLGGVKIRSLGKICFESEFSFCN